MSKYIDADCLKAKLDEYYRKYQSKYMETRLPYVEGLVDALDLAEQVINSLQQEQPEVDLEKEMDRFFGIYRDKHGKTYAVEDDEPCFDWKEDELSTNDMRIARYFYEPGRNARKSIWHNVAEEVPTEYGSEVIVACKNKNKEDGIWLYDLIQCWEGKWEPRVNWETPVKWAYVEDLDSARKEE